MEAIGALLGLSGMLALIVGAALLAIPALRRKVRPNLGRNVLIGGAAAFFAGFALSPDVPPPAGTAAGTASATRKEASSAQAGPKAIAPAVSLPQQVKALDSQIGSVELAEINLWVTIDLKEVWTPKQYPFSGAMVIKKIAGALQAGEITPEKEVKYLQVQMTGPTTGRLGEEGRSRFLSLRLAMDDLRKAKLDNMTPPDFLNIADEIVVSNAVGNEVITQFCSDEDYADWGREFCGKVR
jgi:hypothetical protein